MRSQRLFFNVLILLFLVPVSLLSWPDTIEITPDFKWIDAIGYGEMTLGPKNTKELDTANWQKIRGNDFAVPADRKGWVRLHLANSGNDDRFFELYLHSITVNYANIYVLRNGRVAYSATTGNQVLWKNRATKRRDMSLPFIVHAGENVVVYVSVFRRGFMEHVSLNLADARYGDRTFWQDMMGFLIFGYIISIFVLALIASVRQKRRDYLLYALYVVGGGLYLFSSYGYLASVIPRPIEFIEIAPVVFATLSLLSFIFFAKNLLGDEVIPDWFLFAINIFTPVIALSLLFSCLLFATNFIISPSGYRYFAFFSAGWLLFIFFGISVLVGVQVFRKKNREYAWFFGTFISLFLLVTMSVVFEYEILVFSQGLEIFLEIFFVILEITVTLAFFIYYILQELEKEKENKLNSMVKMEEQGRYFSNILHSRLKGRLQSVFHDLKRENGREPVLLQVEELINYCVLADAFTENYHRDLYALLEEAAFQNRSVLNNELEERFFYTEFDHGLKGVELQNAGHIDLLHQFIHDSFSNVKKYAGYKYALLSAKEETGPEGIKLARIEIKDDGVGLVKTMETPHETISLDTSNFTSFSEAYIGEKHTGLKRLFNTAKSAGVRLELRSSAATGTSVIIFLQIQDR